MFNSIALLHEERADMKLLMQLILVLSVFQTFGNAYYVRYLPPYAISVMKTQMKNAKPSVALMPEMKEKDQGKQDIMGFIVNEFLQQLKRKNVSRLLLKKRC